METCDPVADVEVDEAEKEYPRDEEIKKSPHYVELAGETPRPGGFAKGVWKARPEMPLTICGTALATKAPPKKSATKEYQCIISTVHRIWGPRQQILVSA